MRDWRVDVAATGSWFQDVSITWQASSRCQGISNCNSPRLISWRNRKRTKLSNFRDSFGEILNIHC